MGFGHIDFYHGRMNSQKTSKMLMDAYRIEQKGSSRAAIAIPELVAPKDGDKYRPRNENFTRSVDIIFSEEDLLSDKVRELDLGETALRGFFIDEAQFMSAQQVYDLARFANENPTINIKAFGLRADYKMELWEGSKTLFEVANPISMEADCHLCNSDHTFLNARLINGQYTFDPNLNQDAVNEMGGVTYETLCLSCVKEIVEDLHSKGEIVADSVLRVVGIK